MISGKAFTPGVRWRRAVSWRAGRQSQIRTQREPGRGNAPASWAAQLLHSSHAEQGMAHRLELAGLARKPAEWALLGGSACLVLSAAVTIAAGNVVLGVLAGVPAGWLGMRLALSVRIASRAHHPDHQPWPARRLPAVHPADGPDPHRPPWRRPSADPAGARHGRQGILLGSQPCLPAPSWYPGGHPGQERPASRPAQARPQRRPPAGLRPRPLQAAASNAVSASSSNSARWRPGMTSANVSTRAR